MLAGESGVTPRTIIPLSACKSIPNCLSYNSTSTAVIPIYTVLYVPSFITCSIIDFTVFIGIEKPKPSADLILAVFIPITSPLLFNKGPPLFPGLIEASV